MYASLRFSQWRSRGFCSSRIQCCGTSWRT